MSKKSKRNRGKTSFQAKQRGNELRSQQVADTRWRAAPQGDKPVAATAPPLAAAPGAPKVVSATFNYSNILFELRSVLLLFGVILAALITVALIIR